MKVVNARKDATTAFLSGSTRTMDLRFGTPTQTEPPPVVSCMKSEQHARAGPTRIVATTRFVAGSIRETLGPPLFATQTAPGETEIPSGCGPTGIVAVTLFVCGSTRETVLSEGCETHTAPLPAAASLQACGNAGHCLLGLIPTRAITAFRAGSMRRSVESLSLIAQTALSPTASPPLPCGMLILATTVPTRGQRALPAGAPAAVATTATAHASAATAFLGLFMFSSSIALAISHVRSKHRFELMASGIALRSPQVEGKPSARRRDVSPAAEGAARARCRR